ncbi:unnamed protein product [Coccothraustes coccothraustes]
MGSVPSLHLPAAPPAASKATQTDWNCPVCHSAAGDTAAVPCGHQFCLGCLLRHTAGSATCPQCASPVLSARFSVLGHHDFLQCLLSPAAEPPAPAGWARRGLIRLVHTGPAAAEPPGAEPEEEFPVELRAELQHGHERLLEPVRPWLRHSLDSIYGPQWWEARQVETVALATLCICGPDRAELTHMLQSYLGDYTAPLIHGLVHVAMHGCRQAWLRRRATPALEDEPDEAESPGLAPVPARPGRGERPGLPEPGGTGRPPAALAGQERPRGSPEQRQARAGPQEDALPVPGPSAKRRPPVTRSSKRRKAHKPRRPLRVRRRKPRRK